MSSTDEHRADQLAAALFDEALVPLAERRRRTGRQTYFPLHGEVGATTYFDNPDQPVTRSVGFEFPGGGTPEGLLDALLALWIAQGETDLAAIVPQLRMIAEALRHVPAETNGEVNIFCYTMY